MAAREDIINHSTADQVAGFEYPQWLKDRLSWFQDQKLGLFLHWGPYCQWDCCESWPLVPEDDWARSERSECWSRCKGDLAKFQQEYWALNRTFNPVRFNPEAWAAAAKDAGMRYVTFTTKHHDGFCMFDTKLTDYKVTNPECPFHSHPRANIVREVFNAFRAEGLGISCYFSKSDWRSPYYWSPEFPVTDRNPNYDTAERRDIWEKFVQFAQGQMRELLTDYGPIDVLWLDGGQVRPPKQDIRMAEVAAMGRVLQPQGLIIADRTVGGPFENILTPEQVVPDEPMGHTWESCVTLGSSWKYVPNMKYKPTRQVIRLLVDIVAKDGNLLLGVGPTPAGELPGEALEGMARLGDWMRVNGDAIHGTRAITPYAEGDVRYTQGGGRVHAILLADEGGAPPPKSLALRSIQPAEGASVRMLGVDAPLAWRREDGAAVVEMPERLPCEHAWTVAFPLDDAVRPQE